MAVREPQHEVADIPLDHVVLKWPQAAGKPRLGFQFADQLLAQLDFHGGAEPIAKDQVVLRKQRRHCGADAGRREAEGAHRWEWMAIVKGAEELIEQLPLLAGELPKPLALEGMQIDDRRSIRSVTAP